MKKTITLLIMIALLAMLSASAVTQGAESSKHTIEINTENGEITVKESIILNGETDEIVNFWIQNGAEDLSITSGEIQLTKVGQDGSVYSYKITSPNITEETQITVKLSYTFKNIESFQKKVLLNNTADISVKLNDEEIYTAKNLKNESYFDLTLYEISEAPLTWYIIGFIVLLIILLGVTATYSFKKQKPGKKTDTSGGSGEFLSTKKTLLMSLLKEIEKQHRAKKISDDTYHKLKDQYKKEAVDAMKQLEEIESKVK